MWVLALAWSGAEPIYEAIACGSTWFGVWTEGRECILHNTILEAKKEGGCSVELWAKEEKLGTKDEELQTMRAELEKKGKVKIWIVLVMLLLLGVVISL